MCLEDNVNKMTANQKTVEWIALLQNKDQV